MDAASVTSSCSFVELQWCILNGEYLWHCLEQVDDSFTESGNCLPGLSAVTYFHFNGLFQVSLD